MNELISPNLGTPAPPSVMAAAPTKATHYAKLSMPSAKTAATIQPIKAHGDSRLPLVGLCLALYTECAHRAPLNVKLPCPPSSDYGRVLTMPQSKNRTIELNEKVLRRAVKAFRKRWPDKTITAENVLHKALAYSAQMLEQEIRQIRKLEAIVAEDTIKQ